MSNQSLVCVVKMLMVSPRTTKELIANSGVTQNTIDRYLQDLHDAGLIYITGFRRRSRLWAWQPNVFQLKDFKYADVRLKRSREHQVAA